VFTITLSNCLAMFSNGRHRQ